MKFGIAKGARVKLRHVETWLRCRRIDLSKKLSASVRGRKLVIDFLPRNVTELTVDCGDHRLVVSPHELIGRHVVAKGHYSRDRVSDLLSELDSRGALPERGGCLLEIGANIGTHTVYFAVTGRFGRIVSVEPDPRNLSFLRKNVALNGITELVQIIECAAGEGDGELSLHRVAGNYGNSSFLHTHPTGDSVIVSVRPVDAILATAGISEESISLVWMDIEGFEPQAVKSMLGLLKRQVPLYIEFTPELYGAEGTRAFVNSLAQHYDECIVMKNSGKETMAVRQLISLGRQCDVLFLPGQSSVTPGDG